MAARADVEIHVVPGQSTASHQGFRAHVERRRAAHERHPLSLEPCVGLDAEVRRYRERLIAVAVGGHHQSERQRPPGGPRELKDPFGGEKRGHAVGRKLNPAPDEGHCLTVAGGSEVVSSPGHGPGKRCRVLGRSARWNYPDTTQHGREEPHAYERIRSGSQPHPEGPA